MPKKLEAVGYDNGAQIWESAIDIWKTLPGCTGVFTKLNPPPPDWPSRIQDVDVLGITMSSFERTAEQEAVRLMHALGRPCVSWSDTHNTGDRVPLLMRTMIALHFVPTNFFAVHAKSVSVGGYKNVVVAPPAHWRREVLTYQAARAPSREACKVFVNATDVFRATSDAKFPSRGLRSGEKIAFLTGTKAPDLDVRRAQALAAVGFVIAYTVHPGLKAGKTSEQWGQYLHYLGQLFDGVPMLDVRGLSKHQIATLADANVFTGGSTDSNLVAMANRTVLYLDDARNIERNKQQGIHTPLLSAWNGRELLDEYPNGVWPLAGLDACVVADLDRGPEGLKAAFEQLGSASYMESVRRQRERYFPVPTEIQSHPGLVLDHIKRLVV